MGRSRSKVILMDLLEDSRLKRSDCNLRGALGEGLKYDIDGGVYGAGSEWSDQECEDID
jgi:hypothetical protein